MDLRRPPFILLDDQGNSAHPSNNKALLFTQPQTIIRARSVDAVLPALSAADKALADGWYLAGWIAYEAAAAFEPRMKQAIRRFPQEDLVWFGVFPKPCRLDPHSLDTLMDEAMGGTGRLARITDKTFCEDSATHARKLARIMEALKAGEIYQINHTFPVTFRMEGDALSLYRTLRRAQPVPYGAYIDTGDRRVLSWSPELFVRSSKGILETRPMKGTASRGIDKDEDDANASALAADEKSRAENLMITDLLRNDLSRISRPGSVHVPALFTVERYKTILQMTSTVKAERDNCKDFSHLIRALFPCGSITGAPKLRAMDLIGTLEDSPRGLYTGAIGWAAPDGDLCFSVAIRTAVEQADGCFQFGVGSGIVADSNMAKEYEECRLKAQFMDYNASEFSLIETLAWHPNSGYVELSRHLHRLRMSAAYFNFPFDKTAARDVLHNAATLFRTSMSVRFLLGRQGTSSVTATGLGGWPNPVQLALMAERLDSRDPFVRHKTTRRHHYEKPLRRAIHEQGADEVIFLNERGELCEGARSTLFLRKGDDLLTPPLRSGLLPGIFRSHMIETGKAREAILYPSDLANSPEIFVGNSVRGLGRACLIKS